MRRRRGNDGTRAHIERATPLSYNLAFAILGPTPRVARPEPKRRGSPAVYPDAMVVDVRMMRERGWSYSTIAAELEKRVRDGVYAKAPPATWVGDVCEGIIRANVR